MHKTSRFIKSNERRPTFVYTDYLLGNTVSTGFWSLWSSVIFLVIRRWG